MLGQVSEPLWCLPPVLPVTLSLSSSLSTCHQVKPEASLWHQAPFPRFTMMVPLYHKTFLRSVSYWLHSSSRSFAQMKFVPHLVNSLFPSLIQCQFLHQVSQSELTPWHYVPSIHSAQWCIHEQLDKSCLSNGILIKPSISGTTHEVIKRNTTFYQLIFFAFGWKQILTFSKHKKSLSKMVPSYTAEKSSDKHLIDDSRKEKIWLRSEHWWPCPRTSSWEHSNRAQLLLITAHFHFQPCMFYFHQVIYKLTMCQSHSFLFSIWI